ncbi:hypothetical protein SAMN04488023_11211 [Pedobacter rhizosphaerae]|uniref:Uncharacterized protein n=1 Tax=Pedobacter rhizosphaerae TaxID=390241 RepID=A0A1H9QJ40_9SPHI|nr:hypothetical protein SAMN04488023_11211 [Pedobacter rhizosphaerae]
MVRYKRTILAGRASEYMVREIDERMVRELYGS